MGSKTSKERIEVVESQLIGFEVNRCLFFWTILIISATALLGNFLAIKTVIKRKYKYLQRTCIISLAFSDILTVVLFAMNNLDLLNKKLMTWIYGEFLCHYMPVGQVLGNLTSSVALLVIALDRYHNVIHVVSKKWDPYLWKCLIGSLILWAVCLGLSYPVVTFYAFIPITLNGEDAAICSGVPVTKSTIFLYYICMNCLFFIPIVLMFFWFYYKIALLIWRHRKPPAQGCNDNQEITESSSAAKSVAQETSNSSLKKKNVQMERKIRSFKIVLTLIAAFIGCRLPYWFCMLYQQVYVGDRNVLWNIRFSSICLHLLNCALNPFLYTFLNITIIAYKKIVNFLKNILCCWFSDSDFEDFEKGSAEGIMGVDKNVAKPNIIGILNNDKLKVELSDANRSKYIQRETF